MTCHFKMVVDKETVIESILELANNDSLIGLNFMTFIAPIIIINVIVYFKRTINIKK